MISIDETASKLRGVLRLLIRRVESFSGKEGPTRSEQRVLACLDEHGEMTPSALAALEQVRPQTMQQTLDSLERRRWIKRRPHPTDRRRILFSLRVPGEKALAKGRHRRQQWLVSELTHLSPQERRLLVKSISILERMCVSNPT
jgi:DNA-binding MarR family transcriptional regulator